MSKAEFLTNLEKEIATLPQLEKERIMNYYNETLEDAMEDGMSQEEAVASLGELAQIVKQIKTEHTMPVHKDAYKSNYVSRFLIFIACPFWLTAVALIGTLYLVYLTVLLCLATLLLSIVVFVIMGCINVAWILLANFASGILLIGFMLTLIGIFPWVYRLLVKGIDFAKVLYRQGIENIVFYWRKAMA